jgi:hypothetical protein
VDGLIANAIVAVQECDATGDDLSSTAGYQYYQFFIKELYHSMFFPDIIQF